MNHIPVEVLREIFTKLDLNDKIECMLVCRFWYDMLDRFRLLCSLSVQNHQFPKFKDMLIRFPHRFIQVEYLTLNQRLKPYFDKGELCNMFPNLREISFSISSGRAPQIHMAKPFQFLHAICKLEKIKDFGGCELAPQLAMSNLCINLKSLELDFIDFIVAGTANNVISQLKNMPVLKELSMTSIEFKLMDLEIMHSNIPSLKRLCLESAYPISGEIPKDVVPASLITELEVRIQEAETQPTRIQFYKYIGNKYPSLKNPFFDDFLDLSEEGTDIIPDIYNGGIFPLYQKIGSQVDTFLFSHYYDGLDAFRKFDDYGMKLKELTIKLPWQFEDVPFIEELARSQQSKYIQKLSLWDILPDPIHMINHLEVLDTLVISSKYFYTPSRCTMRKEISLTQFIYACPPTLTTLTIASIYLTFDESASTITNIKHLKLIDVEFTPVLASIIETSFPKLSTLTLTGDITSNVTIALRKHNLKEVNITATYDEEMKRNEYTIESKCDDGVQCHTLKRTPNNNNDGQLNAYDRSTKPVVEMEPVESFTLKFICLSVKQISVFTEQKIKIVSLL